MIIAVEAKLASRQHQAGIVKLGGDLFAGNLVNLLLIEKLEGVAAADLALEIDRKAHYPHIFGKRVIGNVVGGGGAIDRIIDDALRVG